MARSALFTNRRKGRGRHHATFHGRVYISTGGVSTNASVSEFANTQDSQNASTLVALTAPEIEWPMPRASGGRAFIARQGWIQRGSFDEAGVASASVAESSSAVDASSATVLFATVTVSDVAGATDTTDATGGSAQDVPPGSRGLTQAVANAIVAGLVRPAIFYEGEFSGGILRLWSGLASFPWNGHTWAGAGNMLGISAIGETSEVRAVAFEVSLSGAISELVSIAIAQGRQGLPGRVWLGFFDNDGNLIQNPFKCFDGRMDVMDITDDAVTARIAARYESRLIDLDRSRERRYTSEDQRLDYPSDLGFDYVPALQNMPLFWGRVSPEVRQQRQQELIDLANAVDAGQFFNPG